ncbi:MULTISPECIES: putative protein N(5)-glutamine methyltransferase [Arthrobacter]|uniref:Release factor glutamine methyltransferase n=2 Tax=Arthrobacter TaxID=1663 RepID=A0ABU9KMG9_9MICC|nr:putative protein N(5)-glutamine methyltransferase [Arthrobacter sp. YJM1]MDP5227977.1 putative protein N(5)-glutamine methyltransferase [Arthrobacter sp. YJM1]
MTPATVDTASLILRLRAAGCVFAEEEAAILESVTDDAVELDALCLRRERGEPLEHLVGWVDFGGLRLTVGPGVFIPRQRSLFLAGLAVEASRAFDSPLVHEAFCGAAPLASWVRHHVPGARLQASDVDPVSLGFARRNLGEEAELFEGPGLTAIPAKHRGRIDVLAAVPPYVPLAEAEFMPHESREHEPGAAVFAGEDGLDFVRELMRDVGAWLSPGGRLLLELNRHQLPAAVAAAGDVGLAARGELSDDGQTAVVVAHRR